MEIEIIKTDNPDIVIEKTTIEREINIAWLREQIESFENFNTEIDNQIEQLEQSKQWLPDFILSIINEKINNLLSEKTTAEYQIELLNNEINKVNG